MFGVALSIIVSILDGMDGDQKVRENRLRRVARRRGFALQRYRAIDHGHVLYGTYQLVDGDGTVVAAKEHKAFGKSYGLTLDEAEKYLTEGAL